LDMEALFFQADDGIRGKLVTGVQTCALPISAGRRRPGRSSGFPAWAGTANTLCRPRGMAPGERTPPPSRPGNSARRGPGKWPARSEERRVGKSVELGGRRSIKKENM